MADMVVGNESAPDDERSAPLVKARRPSDYTLDGRGQLLGGRYELGRLLGCGGMANVYRARDRTTGQDVAVKVFRPGLDFADAQRHRKRELGVLAALHHPGLVSVLDADTSDGSVAEGATYLVVELVDGPTLGRQLRDGPLPENDVRALGATLCSAVAYMHEHGVVHRDIKPANILLADVQTAPDLAPKLTDFGIARVIGSTAATGEGLTVGTANYLSPEQVGARDVGAASDVYSIGLVLIEALTATIVYPGLGVEAALARLHRRPVLPDGIGDDLADLLTRMTERDPLLRPSAAAAAAELAGFADSSFDSDIFAIARSGRSSTPVVPRSERSRARRRFGVLAGAAATIAAIMTSGLVFAGGDPPDANQHDVAAAAVPTPVTPSSSAAAPPSTPPSTPASPRPTAGARPAVALHDGVAANLAVLRSHVPRSHPTAVAGHHPAAAAHRTHRTHARTHATATTARQRRARARAAAARARRAAARRAHRPPVRHPPAVRAPHRRHPG